MPLAKLAVTIAVHSLGRIANGPSQPADPFDEESTTRYAIAASGAGSASNAYADYRLIPSAGNEDFDLASVATPLVNRNREMLVLDRVTAAYIRNYSTTANLVVNKGPNACPLFSGTLGPGEDMVYRSGPAGLGRPITPGTASGFRVTSDADGAVYSIYIAGTTAYTPGSATLVASSTLTATAAPTLSGSATLTCEATVLGTSSLTVSGSATLACVASIPFAASTLVTP